ncbi:hypothetical protein J3E68DRAFT_418799 [Trichoderma sp. SZMC 28012]
MIGIQQPTGDCMYDMINSKPEVVLKRDEMQWHTPSTPEQTSHMSTHLHCTQLVSGNKAEVGSEIISARLCSAGYQAKLLVSGTKVRLHREFLHAQ